MTFEQQVQMFNNADIIVAQAGAALANIMFMRLGKKVIALTAETKYINYDYFIDYAKIFDVDFEYCLGSIEDPKKYDPQKTISKFHPINALFRIDLNKLLNML